LIHQRLERQGALAGIGGGDQGFSDRHGRWDGNERKSMPFIASSIGKVRPARSGD
jgi:hypothetical protein